jgi:hypothetical protein
MTDPMLPLEITYDLLEESPVLPLEITYDLLEVSPILPLEILKEIALKTPAAYCLLTAATKLISFDLDWVMKHFTTPRRRYPNKFHHGDCEGSRLPSGNLHIINDTDPSVIRKCGTMCWYYNGEFHRNNDLPTIVKADGTQFWHNHGERHRDNDLPAVIYFDGTMEWYFNGELHRDNNLPAVINSDGSFRYFRHDVEYTPEI